MSEGAWRLIPYSEHDGATNMAIDEAILSAHGHGEAPPTVRLYGFVPPCVTIGYGQKLPQETIDRIRAEGFDLVRRPTGGRAVLHLHDLTYSFVGTSSGKGEVEAALHFEPFLSPSINGAYREICAGLIAAFQTLGLELELGLSDTPYKQLHDCFLATTTADLHYNGRKLAGSAQLRRRDGVLQHGSILLEQNQSIMERLLTGRSDHSKIRHANLFETLNRRVPMEELQLAIKQGFETVFEHEFALAELTAKELETATQLRPQFLLHTEKVQPV